jgi:pantoate--beta-alanine ligase
VYRATIAVLGLSKDKFFYKTPVSLQGEALNATVGMGSRLTSTLAKPVADVKSTAGALLEMKGRQAPMQALQVWKTIGQAQAGCAALKQAGKRIGVVPTMGALHDGHLSLVRGSLAQCDATVVTIFVNPTQFGPGEDLSRYPQTWDQDLAALSELGVDAVFAPTVEEMYADGTTFVEPPAISKPLEGVHRPGHFRGVATIVLKLFHAVPADAAYFGQKDYQQAMVVSRMVQDLNCPIEMNVLPIVRDADGLALSSRNAYLTPADRQRALALHQTLRDAKNRIEQGCRDGEEISEGMLNSLSDCVDSVEYALLADPATLDPISAFPKTISAVIGLIAVYVGKTRLIDNEVIHVPS